MIIQWNPNFSNLYFFEPPDNSNQKSNTVILPRFLEPICVSPGGSRNRDSTVTTLLYNGGAVASWLVRSTPERAVRVQALVGNSVLRSWARHFTLTVPLSTQEYKWVPAICWGNLTKIGE